MWVLDPSRPSDAAKRGRDAINNIEQVTIDSPSGTYLATVKPTRITSTSQQYALVYWIEEGDFRLTYPNGHELFAPGDNVNVCWQNNENPVTIEVSYDGGKNFTTLKTNVKGMATQITLPETLPPTGEAVIRVVDGNRSDVSDASFAIIRVPELTLIEPHCDPSALKLQWESIDGVDRFQVLKANVDEGTFTVIEDEVSATEYAIPENQIETERRNVFAVRAVLDDGTVSRRSHAHQVKAISRATLTAAQLPFVEHFVEHPSRLLSMDVGSWMLVRFSEQAPEMGAPAGAHVLGITPFTNADDWDEENPFDVAPSNRVGLTICSLDLTGVKAEDKPTLRVKFLLEYSENPTDSQFRLLINGEEVADLAGQTHITGLTKNADPYRYAVYDLSSLAGGKGRVEIQYAGRMAAEDKMLIAEICIEKHQQGVDLRLLGVKAAPSDANIDGEHPISIILENRSAETLKNVPLAYRINEGKWSYGAVESLKPYELMFYTFVDRGDFTTTNPLGERMTVEVVATHPGDIAPENNSRKIDVTHYGHMFLMPRTLRGSLLGKPTSTDPQVRKIVQGSLLFADQGGKLEGYPNGEDVSLRFEPATPGNFIHISFREFDTERHFDQLAIYTSLEKGGFPSAQDKPNAILSGNLTGRENLDFYSTAEDGAIVLKFTSDPYDIRDGWLADVREVPRPNLFTLTMEEFDHYVPDGQHPVKIAVQNHAPVPMEEVEVAYCVDGNPESWVVEKIARIEGNATAKHTFSQKADLSEPGYHTIAVEIRSDDLVDADNRVERRNLVNDIGIVASPQLRNPTNSGWRASSSSRNPCS